MKTIWTLPFLTLVFLSVAKSTPIDELASPDQAVRDKAAAELRTTFQGTPEAKWTPTIDKIRSGQTKQQILELLRPFKVTEEGGAGSGGSHSQSYRLDNEWILICWFQNDGDRLIDRKLVPSLKNIWIAPPNDFTGVWVVYFVNGHKSHQIQYRNGMYFGEFIAYHSDGSKRCIQHFTSEGIDGEATDFYPSGNVSVRTRYKSGKPVGTWTWYDETGKVTSTQNHTDP